MPCLQGKAGATVPLGLASVLAQVSLSLGVTLFLAEPAHGRLGSFAQAALSPLFQDPMEP